MFHPLCIWVLDSDATRQRCKENATGRELQWGLPDTAANQHQQLVVRAPYKYQTSKSRHISCFRSSFLFWPVLAGVAGPRPNGRSGRNPSRPHRQGEPAEIIVPFLAFLEQGALVSAEGQRLAVKRFELLANT